MTIRQMLDELMNVRFCLEEDQFEDKYRQFQNTLEYQIKSARDLRKILSEEVLENL